MTPAEQAITLTENATSTGLPKWRWLPGMLDAVDGSRLVTAAGSRYAWGRATRARLSFAHLNEGHTWLPDFNDPTGATQGCLALLLREAWGPDVTIVEMSGSYVQGLSLYRVVKGVNETLFTAEGVNETLFTAEGTLAACRVAALAAAPSEADAAVFPDA